jgi:hypothetical protein
MDKDFKLINNEEEVLVEGVNEGNWKKGGVFLDDDELCKQLIMKSVLLAQASWQESYYGIHTKHMGSGLEYFKSHEEDSA